MDNIFFAIDLIANVRKSVMLKIIGEEILLQYTAIIDIMSTIFSVYLYL